MEKVKANTHLTDFSVIFYTIMANGIMDIWNLMHEDMLSKNGCNNVDSTYKHNKTTEI